MQSATSRGAEPNRQPLRGKILRAHVMLSFNTRLHSYQNTLDLRYGNEANRILQIVNLSLTCTKEVTAKIKTVQVHMFTRMDRLATGTGDWLIVL